MKFDHRFIVKVQRPLVTSGPPNEVFVYDRRRSVEAMLPAPRKLRQMMGEEFKQFWYAHMEGTVLHLDGIAPWQEW